MQSTETKESGLDAAYYEFTQDVENSIFEAMAAVRARSTEQFPARPPILQLRGGYAESPGWFLIQATEFDPEPLTVQKLRVRDTYASEPLVHALLELMASEKWLDRQSGGEYYMTPVGRDLSDQSRSRIHKFLLELAPLPDDDMAELEGLLSRIIEGSLKRQDAEHPWCLAHSRNRAPGADALPLDRIRQYLEDLNALRDDAHMIAWKPYFTEGYIWEALTYVCDGQVDTASELFDVLAHRGYSISDYAHALDQLERERYLHSDPSQAHYTATEAAHKVRGKIEKATDAYFSASWRQLSTFEQQRLRILLEQLRDNLRSFVAITPANTSG